MTTSVPFRLVSLPPVCRHEQDNKRPIQAWLLSLPLAATSMTTSVLCRFGFVCHSAVDGAAVRAFKDAMRTNRQAREAAFQEGTGPLPPWWNAAVLREAATGHATLDTGMAKPFWFSPLGRQAHAALCQGPEAYRAFCQQRRHPARWLAVL